MKKTVVALLDQMVNPHWPHLPKRKEKYDSDKERAGIEGVWRTIPDDPLDYHFYYHILDGDEGGRPPKVFMLGGQGLTENKYFNWRDKSCLHVIAKSRNLEALQHPVVRMLVKAKWKSYGHFFLSLQAALYVIFLLCLSYSLLSASTTVDPTQYEGEADSLRRFCEIFTLIMVVFYICEEINQMRLEGKSYFTEWMTLFDWSGLLLILCIIPLRYTQIKAQWLLASLAFLFNFLRIFKFSCLTRTTGLYTKTLAKIILHDVTRSMAVFIVIFFSFCGALSLSLCYSDENQQFNDFGDVLLSGFRALSEQRPIAYDYSNFNWLSILLMMAYMGIVIVILLNILIAQMSTTYTQAKKVARLEYDVDRILQLTRMERFPFLNLRVKYYKEGDWISEMKLAQDLLEFSEDRSPWESVEEKLAAIRDMMRKMVKQMRPGIR
ncbi:transient receptor potential cation channel subfamily V member 5-like [Pocillopora verrucosa]|uniref:transient receptor potential cation channel subfamily V member 5-like n=1 Tax=Pocillopora verrucosa TaxID=203993 RepID=UPI0033400264